MCLDYIVYARYLSGFSAREINKELMIPECKVDFIVYRVMLLLEGEFSRENFKLSPAPARGFVGSD